MSGGQVCWDFGELGMQPTNCVSKYLHGFAGPLRYTWRERTSIDRNTRRHAPLTHAHKSVPDWKAARNPTGRDDGKCEQRGGFTNTRIHTHTSVRECGVWRWAVGSAGRFDCFVNLCWITVAARLNAITAGAQMNVHRIGYLRRYVASESRTRMSESDRGARGFLGETASRS